MAIEVTRSLRGLALPAIRTAGGYFASKNAYDVAWGDLLLTIFCPVGGRFMSRGFGSGLKNVQFELTDASIAKTTEFLIRDAAQVHLPHIVIRRVQIQVKNRIIQIKVTFGLTSDSGVQERLVEVSLSGFVKILAAQG